MLSFFSFFTKKPSIGAFQDLKVDMHSHLIPGIDDGSPDMATSLSLIEGLQSLGYQKIITTPHILADLYPNDTKKIREGLQALRAALAEVNSTVAIEAAAEYFVDRHFENLLEADDILSFGEKRFVLIEMSFVSASPNLEEVIFSLVARGYQPLLAHPERYTYLMNRKPFFGRLKEMGCMMQVNILSLTGYYGRSIQNWSYTLVKNGFIDFLGTDLHHQQHLHLLTNHRLDSKIRDVISRYPFRNQELMD